MFDLDTLGFFLYMEGQEQEEQEENKKEEDLFNQKPEDEKED